MDAALSSYLNIYGSNHLDQKGTIYHGVIHAERLQTKGVRKCNLIRS